MSKKIWITGYGKRIDISRMPNDHLINAINYVKRRNAKKIYKHFTERFNTEHISGREKELLKKYFRVLGQKHSVLNERFIWIWQEAKSRGFVKKG